MDAGGKKLRDGDMADLKNDAMEMERASNLVQHDIEKTKHLIEDNAVLLCFGATFSGTHIQNQRLGKHFKKLKSCK